ncbi:hypothetical protein VE01_01790 [Pseudogymnoascus verrucosus]|uniref:Uncharacterized protein n=1 Tax=Pseudogymnoascus verrucosus TaxID=342668 RepID=A0A1B8GVW4_9PEZI|nr:uncharacterized protein VE01_01790 [Pseudogymnoascus verrucosus]OBT99969.2 hypothetical protein VE01_01790 [Pseudogymnoascus verrucosus]
MSTAIVPSGGSDNSNVFTQQGTVDWTLLSGSTVNFTIEILARLSKAGVEPITAAMGQAIFAGFNLDPDGQIRFSSTISRLKAFSSYGNVMWFGFGVKHIIRTLSETEQGATCAAICACLSVSYDKFFCSKVLKALADQQKAPNTLVPSLSQWAALANICAGAVSGSRFPQLVEVYSRIMQSYDGDSRNALQETTSPDKLARAILELGKVSSGTVQSVTFIGGVDCGWLAALAQWLLSLKVDIVAADGSVLYSSRTSVDPSYYPQVSIVQGLGHNGRGSSTLFKRSVFVMPGKLFFGAKWDLVDRQRHFFSAGRSEWRTILHDTFGADFDTLLHPEIIQDFAELLCCGFSVSDSDNGQRHVDPWRGLSTTSTESRLLQLSFAAQRLPELIPVCQIAKQKVYFQERSYGEHNTFPRVLARHCSCDQCKFHREHLAGKSGHFPLISKKICLEKVALAIFEYIWTLSWLDIDENVYPSVRGLLLTYRGQKTDRYDDSFRTDTIKDKLFQKPLMSKAIELFTGLPETDHQWAWGLSAGCKAGVCAYLPSLKNPTTSPPEQLRVIVVAGHIEWNSKTFSMVKDGRSEMVEVSLGDLASTFVQTYGLNVDLKLRVQETFTSDVLEADLWVSSKPIEPLQRISYHDGHIVDPPPASSSPTRIQTFGAAKIRAAIISSRFTSSCHSESVETNALSIDGPICWSGPCSDAAKYLWVDGYNNKSYSPTNEEWALISQSECCQEIVRGPYQLLYSVICRMKGKAKIRLGSATCLMCLLGTHRNLRGVEHIRIVIGRGNHGHSRWSYSHIRNLERVTVHSFLGSRPSSQVLLTSAKFPSGMPTKQPPLGPDSAVSGINQESNSGVVPGRPMLLATPQTAQSPSEPENTISSNNQQSDSSVAPSPATLPPTSRPAQPPSELGHTTPGIDQKESDSSVIPSQEIKGGIPHRGRDFKSPNPREIQRARSL